MAFRKIKNIVCVEIYQKQILFRLGVDIDIVLVEEGFIRGIGHLGTGYLQISIKSKDDFERKKS
ncbi:hypothetical protein [Clostridium sp. FP1]|uniref:hypothetical protein n=1 Tax=Clostridium sp. FP1 TaxID=2724076 RepID=UPI001CCA9F02|nr:hypothetical protein [Clostridium sp. FP1]MBZ9636323.1 hypothetical protein [Clostridium sp. FP1]